MSIGSPTAGPTRMSWEQAAAAFRAGSRNGNVTAALIAVAAALAIALVALWFGDADVGFLAALAALLGVAAAWYSLGQRSIESAVAGRRTSVRAALDNDEWLALVEDMVELVDEIDRHRDDWDPSRRVLADHMIARVAENLQRSNVSLIDDDEHYDRSRHAVVDGPPGAPGARIAETVSPGFAVEERVLRRARVRL